MSGSEPAELQRYAMVVVVGGGCYGSYYVRQLERAVAAEAVEIARIVVVDRDPSCAVAAALAARTEPPEMPIEIATHDWRAFFNEYLTSAAASPPSHAHDAIVPSPLMPHLMAEWLVDRARGRWPDRRVHVEPFERIPSVPWERAGGDATHYVSFATWTCPINCIEPRTCPVTRGPRSWSLPVAIEGFRRDEERAGHAINTAVLHCRHRSYGVGMFDTAEVLEADRAIGDAGERGAAEVVVGTVSHCHGALTRLLIDEERAGLGSHSR